MMQKALFTSNSKIRIILWTVLFISIFGLIVKFLNFIYVSEDKWPRSLWHSFYSQDSIDTVFIGSSHVYCNIIPQVMDEKTGENNFNLSSGNQRLQESYFDLMEADRLFDIKKVYLEMYYHPSTTIEGVYSNKASIKNSWITTDYMSWLSPVKYKALFTMNDIEHTLDAILPFVRYRKSIFDSGQIDFNIDSKTDQYARDYSYYMEYSDGNGSSEHADKGYFKTDRVADEHEKVNVKTNAEVMCLTDDAKIYLQKIIDYCKKNNIAITLFVSPISQVELIGVEDYDSYRRSVASVAKDNGVEFYDFNLCKSDFFDLSSNEYLFDFGHLNTKGAEIFTEKFYEVISHQVNFNEVSYESYKEKLENMGPQFLGVYYKTTPLAKKYKEYLIEREEKSVGDKFKQGFFIESNEADNEEKHRWMCIATIGDTFEYQITLKSTDSETGETIEEMIQDFSDNKEVEIPVDAIGTATVTWREKNNHAETHSKEYWY